MAGCRASGDISCNACHALDGSASTTCRPRRPQAQLGERNSPTVYNAAGHLAQFWDGRAPDVEAQAKGPVLNPVEMGMPDEICVVAKLASIPGYVEASPRALPRRRGAGQLRQHGQRDRRVRAQAD